MKTVDELLAIVNDVAPGLKSSQQCFIVSVMMDQWSEGFNEARETALESKENEERMKRIEEAEHYADYSEIKAEYDDREEV